MSFSLLQLTVSASSSSSWRAAVSGIMGSTSLACWIVLLVPQLIEQWKLKSAEGIAIGFISIWFLGDVFNLIGAVWARLLPEVIFLAIWFCIADSLMIASYVYYAHFYAKHHKKPSHVEEQQPLLERRRSSTLTDIAMDPEDHGIFVLYIIPILFVIGAGCLGFVLSSGDQPDQPSDDVPISMGAQVMGYCSAALYLGARIPQIIQNHQRKSVEGLSLLFFLFSTLGNLTYAGQILFYRSDWKYVIINMSWLLGSLGTIVEDSVIFVQFYMYRNHHHVEAIA